MYCIYLLLNENKDKTYIGSTNDINRRICEHKSKKTVSTRNFGDFKHFILEKVDSLMDARKREKYWKSCAGRKKLKIFLSNGAIV